MARTREGRFIDAINKLLPKEIHHESCTTPFRGGTPDQYYESDGGVVRIEYKYVNAQTLPKNIDLGNSKKPYGLSPKQNAWLTRAFYNNVTVAVIIGSKTETMLFTSPLYWTRVWRRDTFLLAPWIDRPRDINPEEAYYGVVDGKATTHYIMNRHDIVAWIIERVT